MEFDIKDDKLDVAKSFPGLANMMALSSLDLYKNLCLIKESLDSKVKQLSATYSDFYINKEISSVLLNLKNINSSLKTQIVLLEVSYRKDKFAKFLRKMKFFRYDLRGYKSAINKALFSVNKFERNKLLIAEKQGRLK